MIKRASFFVFCAASLGAGVLALAGCGGGGGSSARDRSDITDSVIIGTAPTPSAAPLRFQVSEIVTLPFNGEVVARNRSGAMAGLSRGDLNGTGYYGAFVLSPSGALMQIPNPEGYVISQVAGINSNGVVVGSCLQGSVSDDVRSGFRYDPQTGKSTLIPTLKNPTAINDTGIVAGSDYTFDSSTGNNKVRGAVYNLVDNTTQKLPDFGGVSWFNVVGVSSTGIVAGTIYDEDVRGNDTAVALYDPINRTLKTIGPRGIYTSTSGGFISENGKVGGVDFVLKYAGDRKSRDVSFDYYYPTDARAFIYDPASGVKTYLPPLDLLFFWVASFQINGSGAAAIQIGYTGTTDKTSVVYRDGRIAEVSTTLSADDQQNWKIRSVFAIDESGVVYATGVRQNPVSNSGSLSVLRLTPQ